MESMESGGDTARRTPVHLWIVGVLALLWNCGGAYDYTMSRLHDADYVHSMMPNADTAAMFAYMDAMPLYASFGWGLGIWAGVLGAVLLLLRSRYAVHAYIASLIGMALSFVYQLAVNPPPPEMDNKLVVLLVVVIGIVLLVYAMKMRARGVLR